jgi:hypothetical protein
VSSALGQSAGQLIVGDDPLTAAMNHTWEILSALMNSFELERRPPVVPVVDLEDIVRWFVTNTPDAVEISGGGVLRRSRPHGNLIFQFFLDDRNEVCAHPNGTPFGRRFVAASIGPELAARLREGNDLLLFT